MDDKSDIPHAISAFVEKCEFIVTFDAHFRNLDKSWFETDLRELTDELLSEKNIKEQGYFDYDYVRKVLSKNKCDKNG